MRTRSPLIATALLAVATLAGITGCGGTHAVHDVPSSAAAVVGSEQISKTELDSLVAVTRRQYAAKKTAFPKADSAEYRGIRDTALRYLVHESELEQKLHELRVRPVTAHDVDAKLAAVKKKLFGASQSAYTQALASTGLTEAEARAQLHDRLVEERLFAAVNAGTSVSDAELRRYYELHKTSYGRAATREIRYILVSSKALADTVASRLRSGADFAVLARRYSKDTASAAAAGAITISQGNSIAGLEQAAFALETGAVSRPVKTRYGWNIIEAVGPVHPGKYTPFAKLEGQLRATLLKTKRQTRWTAFLANVKKQFATSVRYQTGYAPTTPSSGP